MTQSDLIALAKLTATKYSLPPALVCAVCEQESGWNPYAFRYEQGFYDKYLKTRYPLGPSTESVGRASSWGLMQIMGESAREINFDAASFPVLCDPATGLDFGCKLLFQLFTASKGDLTKTLLKWNGGSDKQYPVQVIARMNKYA